MTGRLSGEVPSETAQAWDSVRRVREPLAWILLVVIAIAVLVSAWQLFGLPGAPVPTPPRPVAVVSSAPVPAAPSPVAGVPGAPPPSPVTPTPFGLRASVLAPNFAEGGVFLLPVLSVILVAFAGGVTGHARQVVQGAVSIQAVALGLGLVSWLGALGAHVRPGVWFIFDATELAAVAAALIFTVAVLRSRALHPLTPELMDFADDAEGPGDR